MSSDDHSVHIEGLNAEGILAYLKELATTALEMPPEKAEQLTLETPLVGGMQLDSLAQAVLLAEVEERFDFVFEMEDRDRLQKAETIGHFVQIVIERARKGEGIGT